MADNTLPPVGRVEPANGGGAVQAASSNQSTEQTVAAQRQAAELQRNQQNIVQQQIQQQQQINRTGQTQGAQNEEKAAKENENSNKPKSLNAQAMDVRIQFHVDQKTKEVTVVIVDKVNHKVLRTVPAEDLKKFQDGGLFDLFV